MDYKYILEPNTHKLINIDSDKGTDILKKYLEKAKKAKKAKKRRRRRRR